MNFTPASSRHFRNFPNAVNIAVEGSSLVATIVVSVGPDVAVADPVSPLEAACAGRCTLPSTTLYPAGSWMSI